VTAEFARFTLLVGKRTTLQASGRRLNMVKLFVAMGHPEIRNRVWVVASGLLSVVAAIIVAVFPGISLVTLAIVLGVWLIFFGPILIGRRWMLRALAPQNKPMASGTVA
jgi:hypothetical protein